MAEGGGKIWLEIEESLQAHELHGLNNAAIAHNQKATLALIPLLGQLNKSTQSRGINEINTAQIKDQRQ